MLCDKDILGQAKRLIEENDLQAAKRILDNSNDKSIWCKNAVAVCFMRMNRYDEAAKILTQLVFPSGTVIMGLGIPDKIKLNLAEAMLLIGNIAAAVDLMKNIDNENRQRQKLTAAVQKWKKSLPFFSRLAIMFGILPYETPIDVESPHGEV